MPSASMNKDQREPHGEVHKVTLLLVVSIHQLRDIIIILVLITSLIFYFIYNFYLAFESRSTNALFVSDLSMATQGMEAQRKFNIALV